MKTLPVCSAVIALCCGMASGANSIDLYHWHDFTLQAAAPGNPFDVELTGVFTGPSGFHIRVPGFYDGEGRWVIRFSPTREGDWELRPSSPLAALDGKTEAGIRCVQLTLNLLSLDASEQAQTEWVDTWTGKREQVTLNRTEVHRNLSKPESFGKAPAVLVVR